MTSSISLGYSRRLRSRRRAKKGLQLLQQVSREERETIEKAAADTLGAIRDSQDPSGQAELSDVVKRLLVSGYTRQTSIGSIRSLEAGGQIAVNAKTGMISTAIPRKMPAAGYKTRPAYLIKS